MIVHYVFVPFVVGIAVSLILIWGFSGLLYWFDKNIDVTFMISVSIGYFVLWGIGSISMTLVPKLQTLFSNWFR